MSSFAIQVGNPLVDRSIAGIFQDLSDVVQEAFHWPTEDAILYWNRIPVRISYKYDLYVMMDDILPTLGEVLNTEEGSSHVRWASNTFDGAWDIQWRQGRITVIAEWNKIVGGYENTLQDQPQIEATVDEFLAEWKGLLGKVLEAVDREGVDVEDRTNLDILKHIMASVPHYGQLYAQHDLNEQKAVNSSWSYR